MKAHLPFLMTLAIIACSAPLLMCTSEWECGGLCYSEKGCKGIVVGCPPPGTGMAQPDGGAADETKTKATVDGGAV